MNDDAGLVSIAVVGEYAADDEHPTAQHLEDARLGIPLDDAPPLDRLHAYRRRPGSTVYHSHMDCAAWPLETPYVELVGAPLLGMACRDCAELRRILPR
jgi:hypothetical protein